MDLADLLETIRAWPAWVTYGALFFGAFIEYVLPPFPGDALVVAGAVLVTAFDWSLWPVLGLVTAGGVAGAAADYALGRWLVRSGRVARLRPAWGQGLAAVSARFERHGPCFLAVNRFVPGIRAFFFVAAAIAGLRLRVVLLWATVSALLWNALLLSVGYALGDNLEAIEAVVSRYTVVMWLIVAAVVSYFGVRWIVRSRRARASRSRTAPSDRR